MSRVLKNLNGVCFCICKKKGEVTDARYNAAYQRLIFFAKFLYYQNPKFRTMFVMVELSVFLSRAWLICSRAWPCIITDRVVRPV